MSASKLMILPVILSRPEKLAFLLTILLAGGSVTTSSPGCKGAAAPGTLLVRRGPGGDPGGGLAGGATATPPCDGCGGATVTAPGAFCGMMLVPGGGAKGCDCTDPGGGTPCPGSGRFGVGRIRPCGSSGTSSSSSCCWTWPRGTLPGGRGAGSEKILP